MARGRSNVAIGFMIVWLVFWGAGMLVVLYGLAGALRAGNAAGSVMMIVWLAAAGFGLWAGIRKLRGLVLPGEAEETSRPANTWRDTPPSPADDPAGRRFRHGSADPPAPPAE